VVELFSGYLTFSRSGVILKGIRKSVLGKREALTKEDEVNVRKLVKELEKLDPELEVHVWDFGMGNHVPIGYLDVQKYYVLLENEVLINEEA
jgi:hypothetical protein